jgi:Tol biopolymer transport system component
VPRPYRKKVFRERNEMTQINHIKTTVFLAVLLATLVLALVTTGKPAKATFPGSTGAIAFVTTRDGGNDIYRMNGDGYGQTRLTETPGMNQDPAWSADGKKILFTNRNWDDIFQMNADGSEERNLTNAEGMDFSPTFFRASTKVAFASFRGETFQTDIYTMTLSSNGQVTDLTRITTSGADDFQPVVSPDGKRIAFASDRDGDFDLYVMKAAPESATNRPVKLTRSALRDQSPDWSPDGSRLTFTRGQPLANEVMAMNAAPEGRTNKPVNLSKSSADDMYPAWSPDGKKVAFTSNRAAEDGTTDYDVWTVRAKDGANPTNLTNAPGNDTDPTWQPLP